MPSRSLSSRRKIGYKAPRRAQQADDTSLRVLRSVYGNDYSSRPGRKGEGREDVFHPLEFNAPESWTNLASSGTSTPNTSDMRLLQHFLMHTSGKMSFHPKRKLVWQRVIPDLALKEEYLMHLLLALAGAHSMLQTCVQPGEYEKTDFRHSDKAGPHDFHPVTEQDCPVPIDVQGDLEDAAVTSWPHLLSKEFVFFLQSGINAGLGEALSYTILAHFYLTFVLFEDLWYFEGAFEKETVKINSLVEDLQNAQLHSLMSFPMGVIAEQQHLL
ncbi:uncharacterized protein BDW43DRAFT_317239 [Aspergillus alliaceus]|uniref:uncharacterized protein n=1 Tax=Petromyces alliaceus TaxID=209559 RepID=UPI0012A60492|nr:uncharacterized protein BDW43DRAFT_317239 [Aspergillus alliaceus]KAB8226999.1 hypothetical protein BDW43DRAFT_317239 [Aspergillus alliaceus]